MTYKQVTLRYYTSIGFKHNFISNRFKMGPKIRLLLILGAKYTSLRTKVFPDVNKSSTCPLSWTSIDELSPM